MVEFVGLKNPVRGDAIDWTQPVETTETPPRPVRVLCTDLEGPLPVVVTVRQPLTNIMSFAAVGVDGTCPNLGVGLRNVAPPKPEPVRHEAWMALYGDGTVGWAYGTKENCERQSSKDGRVECRHIVWMSDGSPVPGEDAEVVALSLMAKERDSLKADAAALRTHLVKALAVVDAAVAWSEDRTTSYSILCRDLHHYVALYQNADPATSDSHEAVVDEIIASDQVELRAALDEAAEPTQRQWALFKNGKQISKAHSTKIAAATEAYEHGAVVRWTGDFTPGSGIVLANGYEVKEVSHDND